MHRLASCVLFCALAWPAVAAGPAPVAPGSHWLYAAPVTLRGTLGDAPIQMQLRPKPDEEGLEGDYFRFGASARVLLAGEVDGGELVMEESENGTDVSGQWIGSIEGRRISGTWQDAEGAVSKPFVLNVLNAPNLPAASGTPDPARVPSGSAVQGSKAGAAGK